MPKASPSQEHRASAHVQLWLLASFIPPGFPSPFESSFGKQSSANQPCEGLVAAEPPPISKGVLKPFCSKPSREPAKQIVPSSSLRDRFLPPSPPQVEATLYCHTKLNFLFILQSNLSLHNAIPRFNLITILHITL